MKNNFINNLKNFSRDDNGAVALIVGISLLLVLLGILALSIDMGRTQTSYNKNKDATDAAALGTAEFLLKGIVDQIGKRNDPYNYTPGADAVKNYADVLVRQNFERDQNSAIYDPSSLEVTHTKGAPDAKGKVKHSVTVKACANLVTPIAAASIHEDRTRTCTVSTAGFEMTELSDLEVAFALDYTNSMYWQGEKEPDDTQCPMGGNSDPKCPEFSKTKAKALVDTMNFVFDNYFNNNPNSTIYGSIIPFSGVVNLYPYNKTMVTPASAPTIENITNTPHNYRNWKGDSFRDYYDISNLFADYPATMSSSLNRIPTIASASKFNNIVSSGGTVSSVLPLTSYIDTYRSLPVIPDKQKTKLCYNGAMLASLDQRIERLDPAGPVVNGVGVMSGGIVLNNNLTKIYKYDGKYGDGKNYNLPTLNNRIYELHESFPIQPLTNNTSVLKNTINRFTSNQPLYSDAENYGPGKADKTKTDDRQSNILNKSTSWSYTLRTSSVQGLLWAWFSINNDWKNKWQDKSLSENYFANGDESRNSRRDLPSSEHIKHIILITDGHDNDGENIYEGRCDAYTPTGALSDTQYQALCNKIKDSNIRIHTLLLDFAEPASKRYSKCSSPNSFHENVKPDQLQGIMDGIFKTIITELTTVKLTQ